MAKRFTLLFFSILSLSIGFSGHVVLAATPMSKASVMAGYEGFGIGQVVLFPNPVQDHLSVKFHMEDEGIVTFAMFDVLGNDMKLNKIVEVDDAIQTVTLPMSMYRPGMYILKVQFQSRYSREVKIGYYRLNING